MHSPTQWVVEPMQIDTHNRQYNLTDHPGYKPSFLPRMDANGSVTDLRSGLSPLIECPCSDRTAKTRVESPTILTSGTCDAAIASAAECMAQAAKVATVSSAATVSDAALPSGCLLMPDAHAYRAVFNTAKSGRSCEIGHGPGSGAAPAVALEGRASVGGLVNVTLAHDGAEARLSLSGPADVWFGVGFAASAMAERPYAIIVDGSGGVAERRLENHGPGALLQPSVTVVSSAVAVGVRTVVLTRPVAAPGPAHYALPTAPGALPLIAAVGGTPALAFHRAHASAPVVLLPTAVPACLCVPRATARIVYMNQSAEEYPAGLCRDRPRSDMLRRGDGTGRAAANAACRLETYHGGLHCCKHRWFLTDRAQAPLIPERVDAYFLKWRYYFQEYAPAAPATPASHRHLHHWVFLIDADVNDYEEDNARCAPPPLLVLASASLLSSSACSSDSHRTRSACDADCAADSRAAIDGCRSASRTAPPAGCSISSIRARVSCCDGAGRSGGGGSVALKPRRAQIVVSGGPEQWPGGRPALGPSFGMGVLPSLWAPPPTEHTEPADHTAAMARQSRERLGPYDCATRARVFGEQEISFFVFSLRTARRLAPNRRHLELNRLRWVQLRLTSNRQQLLTSQCTAKAQAYRSLPTQNLKFTQAPATQEPLFSQHHSTLGSRRWTAMSAVHPCAGTRLRECGWGQVRLQPQEKC